MFLCTLRQKPTYFVISISMAIEPLINDAYTSTRSQVLIILAACSLPKYEFLQPQLAGRLLSILTFTGYWMHHCCLLYTHMYLLYNKKSNCVLYALKPTSSRYYLELYFGHDCIVCINKYQNDKTPCLSNAVLTCDSFSFGRPMKCCCLTVS